MAKESNLLKNGVFYTLSTLICMVIPLLFYPYVTRVLGPENYGKIAYIQSYVSYFVIISTLGLTNYAQKICSVCTSEDELAKSAIEMLLVALFLTAIAFILYWSAYFLLPKDNGDTALYIVFSLMVLFSSTKMDWLLVAKEQFMYSSIRDVLSRVVLLVCSFLLIRQRQDYVTFGIVLVFSYNVLPIILNAFYITKNGYISRIPRNRLSLRMHIKPIFYLSLVTLGSKIFSSSDIIMLKCFTDDTAVGLYSNAIKLPLVMDEILLAIAAVITPRLYKAAREDCEDEIRNLIGVSSNTMLFFAVPAIVTCISFPREIVELLGGNEYGAGADVLQIYSWIMLTTLCITLVGTRLFIAYGMEKQLFCFLVVAGVGNIALNSLLIPIMGGKGAAIASVISNTCLLIAEIVYKRSIRYLIDKEKLKYAITGVALFCFFTLFRGWCSASDWGLLLWAIGIGGVLYIILLSVMRESTVYFVIRKLTGNPGNNR